MPTTEIGAYEAKTTLPELLWRVQSVDIHPPSQQDVFGAGHELCLLHGLSAYDARYLQLAMQIGAPLATLDGDLRPVAGKVGIQVFDT